MVGQSLGSIVVVVECLFRRLPDYFFDTIGAPFAFPFVRLISGAKVFAYVHYPVISSDMLKQVREQRPSFNNNEKIARNVAVSSLKLIYYRFFAFLFSRVGQWVDLIIVNSSWTRKHIQELWYFPDSSGRRKLETIFPPCNTTTLERLPLSRSFPFKLKDCPNNNGFLASKDCESVNLNELEDCLILLSIGQFRPEKDHFLQIRFLISFHFC
jgi:alpha-1,2-mannosyltransferase